MSFRNISAWAIRNPVPPIVFFIALLLAGILSFNRMSVNDSPDIDFPAAYISVVQPGAAPSEMETQVTQKVEAAVRGVAGVDEINSTVREGNSGTFVVFQIGTPTDRAVNDVRDAISNIRSDLPDGILEPQIQRVDATGGELAIFSAQSKDMTLEELSWFVDNTVAKRIRAISGVASVERSGGVSREIRVVLDPARMQAQGISASQVNAQLRAVNLNAAGGRAEIAGAEQSVRVLGNAVNAYALSQLNISVGGGRSVKLTDVAEVRDGYAEQRTFAKMDGRQVLSFAVTRAKGASDVTVYNEMMVELDKLKEANPKVSYTELFTSVGYTKEQYKSAIHAMIEGAVLAVLVVFLFLRDWRATLISAIAIPLSAIPAFWFMDLMGFSLNFLSLLALSLVAGVLVDDAIVEIENIVRHMRMGKTAYQASIDAADEIGLAVLATTMSIVAVFLPVGLMPGISGQFFKNFGLTVVAAVLVSLAVARLITPMVAAYFLKSHGHATHGEGRLMDWYMATLRWSLQSERAAAMRAAIAPVQSTIGLGALTVLVGTLGVVGAVVGMFATFTLGISSALLLVLAMASGFVVGLVGGLLAGLLLSALVWLIVVTVSKAHFSDFLRWFGFMGARLRARLFDHRAWIVGIGVLTFACTVGAAWGIPFTFQPPQDNDFSRVRISMTPGSTLRQTEVVADRVREMLAGAPEVQSAYSNIAVGNASVFLTLKADRTQSSIDFERNWAPKLNTIADARVAFQSQNGGGPGTGGRDVNVFLGGDDSVVLLATANKIVEEMKAKMGDVLVAPRTNADLQRPELIIKPRTQLAAELGVTTQALSQAIRIATLGEIDQNSAKFSLNDRQVPIRVIFGEDSRRNLSTVENLPVPTTSGASVPLKVVADISFGEGPVAISRTNQIRRISVGADLAPGLVSGDANPRIDNLPTMKNLPQGVTKLTLGEAKWQYELLISFVIAVITGILLVLATLVLLYKRVMPPLVNMASLVLAPLGGFLAIRLSGDAISMPVLIGMLLLLGIVAKNSILLVDFALEEIDKGVDKWTAIVDAGHKRAQPIVMTTVAMVAGMVPVALSLSGDGSFRAPMGVTVIGGLIVSTLLTLLIVPATFSLAVGVEERLGPWLKRVLTNGGEEGPRAVAQPAE
jgi:multidrug efflux pump subunit AcrB